LAYLFRA